MIAFRKILARSLVIVILLWGVSAIALPSHSLPAMNHSFASIPQPLWLKIAVTVGGIGLIGAELAWFFGNNSQNPPMNLPHDQEIR